MDVILPNKKLAELCNSKSEAQRQLGKVRAEKLHTRLKQFKAARCLEWMAHLPAVGCHELKGERKGMLAVKVDDAVRIVFEPDHSPVPRKRDGGFDWARITGIRICEVGNYHRG